MTVDPTVARQTRFIALWVGVFSVVLHTVFLLLQKWEFSVLWGNLLSDAVGIGNFFLLGLTVQKAVKMEQKDAKNFMKISQTARMLLLAACGALGLLLPCFHAVATLISLFFPRLAIIVWSLTEAKKLPSAPAASSVAEETNLSEQEEEK